MALKGVFADPTEGAVLAGVSLADGNPLNCLHAMLKVSDWSWLTKQVAHLLPLLVSDDDLRLALDVVALDVVFPRPG